MKFNRLIPGTLLSVILISCNTGHDKKQDGVKPGSAYYSERYRPQYHFSPETAWMNDPNGMVFLDGEYHLFYQYFPDSTVWGPMHWGHAISSDMVHWEHLPVALFPDSLGYIFSGSAVADIRNTSGLGTLNNPPLVAIFTYHNPEQERAGKIDFQNQGIAYSLDKGRNWIKYAGNPVLKNPGIRDFRDPKVIWHEDTGKWIMILAVHNRIRLYSSPDLLTWGYESEFGINEGAHGGVWECPDLFPLQVEGTGKEKWVMLVSINPGGLNGGSATQYFTGEFDGHIFVSDRRKEKWLDPGTDNYAGVTWSNIPESDGRRLFLGWMSNWRYATVVPTSVWRSAMTIPRELSLLNRDNEYYLVSEPARELKVLQKVSNPVFTGTKTFTDQLEILPEDFKLMQSKISLEFDLDGSIADTVGLILENFAGEQFIAGYSAGAMQFYVDRTKAGNSGFSKEFGGIAASPYSAGGKLKIDLFIDASSAELFVDDGNLVMTSLFFPSEDYSKFKIFSKGGNVVLERAEFHELDRIWPQ